MGKYILLFFSFITIALSGQTQDFGVEKEEVIQKVDKDSIYTDPYRLTFRIRPISYLLFPVTTGRLASFNARIDYVFSRNIGLGVEANYFFRRPFPNSQIRSDFFSIRVDANYYFHRKSNMDKYAEGFHIGPYYKFKYEDEFDPFDTRNLGVTRLFRTSHIFGPIIGYQYVSKRFVFDQSIGFGAGIGNSNAGLFLMPDFRLGLSIGTVVLQ